MYLLDEYFPTWALYLLGFAFVGCFFVSLKRPMFALYGWITLIPLQFAFLREYTGFHLAVSDIFLAFMCLSLFLSTAAYQRPLRRMSLASFVLALVAVFGISLVVGLFDLGYLSSYGLVNKFIGLGIMVLSCYVTVVLLRDRPERLYTSIKLLLVSGSVVNAVSLILYVLSKVYGVSTPVVIYNRLAGFFAGEANMHGVYLSVVLLLQLGLLMSKTGLFHPVLMWSNSLLLIAGTFLTFTRTAWIGVAIGLSIILLYYSPTKPFSTMALMGLLGTTIATLYYIVSSLEPIQSEVTRPETILLRWNLIWKGLDLWKEQPLFGIGMGVFQERSHRYFQGPIIIHSTYAWLLVETGIVGLGVFLLFLWRICKNFVIAAKRLKENRNVSIAVFAGFVGMIGNMLGIEGLYQRQLWLLIAFSEALYRMADSKGESPLARS